MSVKEVSTGYVPRTLQNELHVMTEMYRFMVLVCHRRFGKTVFVINDMLDRALRNPLKNPVYAYVAPTFGQAEKIAWQYFKDYTKNIPGVETNEQKLRLTIDRPHLGDKITFFLFGAENPDALRGLYYDGVIFDEFGDMDPRTWSTVVRAALSDRLGWAMFIGTPKGQNHFYDIYQTALKNPDTWKAVVYKASETGIIPQVELEAARNEMTKEEYAQEFECSFTAAMQGSYYGQYISDAESNGRIKSVPYDPATTVTTFWDLGIGDTTCIWFAQTVGEEVHCIDYIEMSGKGLEYYVKEVQRKPYIYEEHVLPHDADARELGTGKTRIETLRDLGLRKTRVLKRQTIEDRIHAARMLLSKCFFDKQRCDRGITCLKNYQKKWDPKNKIFQDKPLHDWASNGADAFGYLAQGLRPAGYNARIKELPREAIIDYDILGG